MKTLEKNEKSWKNLEWHTYNFAHISLNKCPNVQNLLPSNAKT